MLSRESQSTQVQKSIIPTGLIFLGSVGTAWFQPARAHTGCLTNQWWWRHVHEDKWSDCLFRAVFWMSLLWTEGNLRFSTRKRWAEDKREEQDNNNVSNYSRLTQNRFHLETLIWSVVCFNLQHSKKIFSILRSREKHPTNRLLKSCVLQSVALCWFIAVLFQLWLNLCFLDYIIL